MKASPPFPLGPILLEAVADKTTRVRASKILVEQIPYALNREDRTTLGGSDAGNCVRMLWAKIRGLAPPAFPPKIQLHKLDGGNLMGAWAAALLKVALEDRGCLVELEHFVETHPREGHLDLLIRVQGHAPWTVDLKWTPADRNPDDPAKKRGWQVLQTGWYAQQVEGTTFSILTLSPAGMIERQDDYDVLDWLTELEDEDRRLELAYGERIPEPDEGLPKWRCESCTFRACERNPKFEPSLVEAV